MKQIMRMVLALVILAGWRPSLAQDCGTDLSPETLRQLLANQEAGLYQEVSRVDEDFTINLAFHILQRNDSTGGPLQADLDFAVTNLNLYYAAAHIQFQLAVQDSIPNLTYFSITTRAEFDSMRTLADVPDAVDLFFVNTLSWAGSNWCGYSSFSGDAVQGIGISNSCVANNALVAHEVGHYFDLYHTHETNTGTECPDGSNCAATGDLLCDTPADPLLGGANVDGNCNYTGGQAVFCNNFIQFYTPNPGNIMSYAPALCQNFFTTGQIGRMRATLTNLRTELLVHVPDLYHLTPSGWSSSVVPRANATATEASCAVSGTLNGNAASTWLNMSLRNGRSAQAGAHTTRAYLDNVYTRWFSYNYTNGHSWAMHQNSGPITVRGGRHSLHDSLDWNDAVQEMNEDNNTHLQQFVWSPLALAQEASVYRSTPPDRMSGTFAFPNCDGFSLTNTGWWEAITVQPVSATADYDIRLHQDYTGSSTGFAAYEASSNYASGQPDWVLINRNTLGQQNWQVGVTNYDGEAGGMYVERSGATTVSLADGGFQSNQLPANRFVDIWELNVGAEDVGKLWNLDMVPTGGDLNLSIYHHSLEMGGRSQSWWNSANEGGASESLQLEFAEAGYYALLVYKDDAAERLSTVDYTLSFSLPPANLAFGTVGDTSSPFLPRGAYELCAQWDPLLSAGLSSLTVAFTNSGLNSAPGGWDIQAALDGPALASTATYAAALAAGTHMQHCNVDLGSVRGGRHEVAVTLDCNGEVLESGESDNLGYAQYAWEPALLGNRTVLSRATLPNWRNSLNPASLTYEGANQDGFTATTQFWTAVAAAPSSTDQLNLYGYNYHSTDPLGALENRVVTSYGSAGATSLVMLNGNTLGNGVLRDLGLANNRAWPAYPSTGGYAVESCQRIQDLYSTSAPLSSSVAAGHLVLAYDLYLTAGQSMPILLDNRSADDLSLAIFDRAATLADLGDALLLLEAGGNGADESGSITVPATGWYGLALFRRGAANMASEAPFTLRLGAPQVAVLGHVDLTVVETDIADGMMHFNLQFPDLVDEAGLPMPVDHYAYYWGYDARAAFPGTAWHSFSSTVASELLNFPAFVPSTGSSSMYFLVVGYSADGLALGFSGPPRAVFTQTDVERGLGPEGAPGK